MDRHGYDALSEGIYTLDVKNGVIELLVATGRQNLAMRVTSSLQAHVFLNFWQFHYELPHDDVELLSRHVERVAGPAAMEPLA